jgi:signal transduction histidine kinase
VETLLVGRVGIAIQGLSHQFFSPLQGALSDVHRIRDNEEVQESALRLIKNFNALNKLATEVQLLLATSGEFNPKMLRNVQVHSMVSDIVSTLTPFATEKNVKIVNSFNRYKTKVEAIPGQFYIVLSNLIQNAVKYSYKGFPDSFLEVRITYTEAESKFLVITVENAGCCITKEEIKERLIFDLGYRGEFSSDRERPGTGVGLYVSDAIVNMHLGRIEVKSVKIGGDWDKGTDRYKNTFSIFWPFYIDI